MGYVSRSVAGAAGPGSAAELLPERYQVYSLDLRLREPERLQETVDDLAGQFDLPQACIQYNDTLLDALGVSYRGKGASDAGGAGFPYLAAAGVLVAALVLLAAGLVIFNILKIAVAKRIRCYGTLRALGAGRGQLYALVGLQLLLLCGRGHPGGGGPGTSLRQGHHAGGHRALLPRRAPGGQPGRTGRTHPAEQRRQAAVPAPQRGDHAALRRPGRPACRTVRRAGLPHRRHGRSGTAHPPARPPAASHPLLSRVLCPDESEAQPRTHRHHDLLPGDEHYRLRGPAELQRTAGRLPPRGADASGRLCRIQSGRGLFARRRGGPGGRPGGIRLVHPQAQGLPAGCVRRAGVGYRPAPSERRGASSGRAGRQAAVQTGRRALPRRSGRSCWRAAPVWPQGRSRFPSTARLIQAPR